MSSQVSLTDTNLDEITIRIAFMDVGQGDTIVLTCPETKEAIVVDCIDADKVCEYLKSEEITYLRGVLVTHYHADHFTGVTQLIENALNDTDLPTCQNFLTTNIQHLSARDLHHLMEDNDGHSNNLSQSQKDAFFINLIRLSRENKIPFRHLSLENYEPQYLSSKIEGILAEHIKLLYPHNTHLHPQSMNGWNLNNLSICLFVENNGQTAFLTGDLEPDGWDELKNLHPGLSANLLKFPHHGAWRRDDIEDLINILNPSVAVISVGTGGFDRYNHPNPHVLQALRNRNNLRILCTQATEQCSKLISEKRESIMSTFDVHHPTNSKNLYSSSGCSCAGTTIVELGDKLKVIQPSVDFHVNQIIKPHFDTPQCNV